MRKISFAWWLAAVLLVLTGCERTLGEEDNNGTDADGNVELRVSIYEKMPFSTRTQQDITQLCSRLNFAFFQGGSKVKTISQKKDDATFGNVTLSLPEGTYQVVIIAHSCDGTATITSPEKVTFPSNIVTDTFYYYGDIEVGTTKQTYSMELERVVAMFRLKLTDPLPSTVSRMKFYYTGGSSTFSPLSGFGCVNSRQTVMMDVEPGQTTFEIYTMPHTIDDVLKIVITAFDANDAILKEQTLENVPVTMNEITQYTGNFFDGTPSSGGGSGSGGSSSSGDFRMTADGEWANQKDFSF